MRSFIVALALASGCATWRPANYAAEASFVTVSLLDWSQTRGITRDCIETNPVIGKCGERAPLAAYFPVSLALHLLVSALLPRPYRDWWQGTTLGAEATTVYFNWRGGYAP